MFAANLLQWGEKEYHLFFAYCTIEETQQLRTLNDLTQNSLELYFLHVGISSKLTWFYFAFRVILQ